MADHKTKIISFLSVFDASPKFPIGALYGSFYQLGNFDQCLSVVQPDEELFSPIQAPVKGKYCLTDIAVVSVGNSGDRIARSYKDEKVMRYLAILSAQY